MPGSSRVPTEEELKYDFVTAVLFIDGAGDVVDVTELLLTWYAAAAEHFTLLRAAVRRTRGFQRISRTEWLGDHPGRVERLRDFRAGLSDRLYRLSAQWSAGDTVLWSPDDHGLSYVDVSLTVH